MGGRGNSTGRSPQEGPGRWLLLVYPNWPGW